MLSERVTQPFLLKIQSAGKLSEEDRDLLVALSDDTRRVDSRYDLISEGDRPDHVHLMLKGWACRYKLLPDGTRQITALLLPGDFCDTHITLFEKMDHAIGTLTESEVAVISRRTMRELSERPGIARALWWGSLVDEAVLRAWIVNMGRREAFDRLAHLVCEVHARLHHVGLAPDGSFGLPLTQDDLADALGLTPVHVSRTLKRLREEGLMTFRRGQIVVTDMPRLKELAQFDPNYLHLRGG